MKQPKIVQSPIDTEYFTKGKNYEVEGTWSPYNQELGYGILLKDNKKNEWMCSEKKCAFLDGADWIIIETEE